MRPICLLSIFIFFFSCSSEPENEIVKALDSTNLLTNACIFEAGQPIHIKFQTRLKDNPQLVVSNAFGRTILSPKQNGQELLFTLPKIYSTKSGLCHWILLMNGTSEKSGSFSIVPPLQSKVALEIYFGPRRITAGGLDYSTLVAVATDRYDNVLLDGTEAIFKTQFLNSITESKIASKDFVSWQQIYSTDKAGRIIVTAAVGKTTSKEMTTMVFPGNAASFLVEARRNHNFADGNQIMSLRTNIIRDSYKNSVADGTLVNFIIENKKGILLKTVAPTIGGIATAAMLHPSEKEEWKITAYVTGAAKSNTINAKFDTAISDFDVNFSVDNRTVIIGPLKSFMQQLVPDGILIQLDVYSKSGDYLDSKKITSNKGLGTILLPLEYYPNGDYQLEIKSVGIIKKYDINLHEK